MERLSERDLEALLTFLRGIYARFDPDGLATCIVETLPEVVPSEWTSYNEVDPQSEKASVIIDPMPPDLAGGERPLDVFERHIHEHPLVRYYQRTGDGRALKVSDFLTGSQFHRLGLYNEFFQKIDVEHQIAITLPAPPPLMIGIAVNRRGRDFSERDRLLLDVLRPHLIQAYHNAGSVARIQRDSTLMAQAVEELDRGVVFLAGRDRVSLCTERARKWLSEYFEPAPRPDLLPESLQRWVEHQRSLLSKNGDVPPPREPLVMEREGKRLVARLVEDQPEDQLLLLLEERSSPLAAAPLQTLGLTNREAEILRWIARGKTNKEIATILYISSLTVKKHLEHIYHKLDVETRTEAVSRALEIFGLV